MPFSSDSDSSDEAENQPKELTEEEKKGKKNSKMMNELLDEFDDDIDRIKTSQVPKSVKYSVYSFGFLVIFLILWGTISEIDTTISASGKLQQLFQMLKFNLIMTLWLKIFMLKKVKVLSKVRLL